MSWLTSRDDRSVIPPMGQGLAVIVSLVAVAIVMAGGILGYIVSLHVAGAGSRGKALDRQLNDTRAQVRQLEEEIGFRSRFTEQERWRTPLGLQAMDLGQYAGNPHQLVTLATARQQRIAYEHAHPCKPGQLDQRAADTCKAGPAGTRAGGYAPEARQEMDGLVGQLMN
jgi:hypothetical protein